MPPTTSDDAMPFSYSEYDLGIAVGAMTSKFVVILGMSENYELISRKRPSTIKENCFRRK